MTSLACRQAKEKHGEISFLVATRSFDIIVEYALARSYFPHFILDPSHLGLFSFLTIHYLF